jgi:hypothetical protein
MQEMAKDKTPEKNRHQCSNPDCRRAFDKPKIMKFCPHCNVEIKDEEKSVCPHFFVYLGQKEDNEGIPDECNNCTKTIECLLKKHASSKVAKEIKKWF